MVLKRSLAAFMLAAMLVSTFAFAFAATASAQSDASEAAEFCRAADESGELDELGITRGECVNLLKGPSSENANNFIAAICGAEIIQQNPLVNATNKGQCIKVVRTLI